MRVLEAISDTNIGGAGILLYSRLKHSNRNRFKTVVVLPKGSALTSRFQSIHIPTISIDGCYDQSLDLFTIPTLCSIIRSYRPSLVNCHGCLSFRIAAKICHVPVIIYTRHCAFPLPSWQRSILIKKGIGVLQTKLSPNIVAVAGAAKTNLIQMGVNPNRIHVIINGAEKLKKIPPQECLALRQTLEIPKDAFVVGICARLEACKGHQELLEAACFLLQEDKGYHFLIIGNGSLEQTLKQFCIQHKIEKYVHFIGFAEDVTPYMNIIDIQVNCSNGTETSSLALSEGMSLGKPAIASNYGGNPYMIQHGINGLIYSLGKPSELAIQIRRLRQNPTLYDQCSKNALLRFERELNAERMTKETEAFYQRLVSDFAM